MESNVIESNFSNSMKIIKHFLDSDSMICVDVVTDIQIVRAVLLHDFDIKTKYKVTYDEVNTHIFDIINERGSVIEYRKRNGFLVIAIYCIKQMFRGCENAILSNVLTYLDTHFSNDKYKGKYEADIDTDIIWDSKRIDLCFIKSIGDINKMIKFFSDSDKKTKLFRGHTNFFYKLLPSITRNHSDCEHNYFWDISSKCPYEFKECRSTLDILAKMQHYQVPTRLLDLTRNPFIALYFSCQEIDKNGEILVFDVDKSEIYYSEAIEVIAITELARVDKNGGRDFIPEWSRFTKKSAGLSVVKETLDSLPDFVFVQPNDNNARIIRQQGMFIIFSEIDETKLLNNQELQNKRLHIDDTSISKIVKFIVPRDYKKRILKQLDLICINDGEIFPEIDKIAKTVVSKYK